MGAGEPVRDVRRPVRLLLLVGLAHEAGLSADPRRRVSALRPDAERDRLGAADDGASARVDGDRRRGAVRGESVPGGVPQQLLRRQRHHESDQSERAPVARQLARSGRAAGLRRQRGSELSSGRHRAGSRRRTVHRGLLQPDHRALRVPTRRSTTGSPERAHLANRVHRQRRRRAGADAASRLDAREHAGAHRRPGAPRT